MAIHRRGVAAAVVGAVAVLTAPGVAWGHGLHYIGTLEATGSGGGTVTATTGQGVTGTEVLPGGSTVPRAAGCAGSPTTGMYAPFDQGNNSDPQGCVDVHTTSGSTSTAVLGTLALEGTGYRPNTTFGVTYLTANDKGDLDGDTEAQLATDVNDPFCHRLYFQVPSSILTSFTTDASGDFGGVGSPVSVTLGATEVGPGQLCITSERFSYRGPTDAVGAEKPTSQGQSVPVLVL